MKFEIGDLVADEDGKSGIVVIQWDDGDICAFENDAAHPSPIIVGHWPPSSHQADPADGNNNKPNPYLLDGDELARTEKAAKNGSRR